MDARKAQLLGLVVETYIATADPVGSEALVAAGGMEVSGATVRNELRELEEAGLLTHPHTSAGRIPTEAGYRYYIDHIMKPEGLKKSLAHQLAVRLKTDDRESMKEAAKYIADEMNTAVLLAFGAHAIYYTGLSQLFSQAEFHAQSFTLDVSRLFDECETRMASLFDLVDEGTTDILIGQDNPLGTVCGSVVARFPKGRIMAIVGPMRMDYKKGLGIAEWVKTAVTE